ncbi:uncharacterized protein M437DRAFT_80326 [Aureobasidium melanogenum CBS 110374]|uniref:F-box domain-containing protein n=1 Tax=Aureobasidium melanogenum (strain CBS 110374) TaxID=1043003 RepID=A0A074W7Y7_AURM1|nr:uncharacterized protein M437DRAFT_80326 [Aureobasidium melanogenum CBS 110374]KEQ67684.1 hypothetical protein M437DRAFT_80326 [Aureobasidium melanogenum CBS 110374]
MDTEALPSDLVAAVIRLSRIPRARRALYELIDTYLQPPHGMLDLPLEILEHVVTFVGPEGLIALRTTCKKLEEATRSRFIDRFIECRRHVLSIYSLKALIDIAAHPHFGRFVKTVILDTTCPFEHDGKRYVASTQSFNHHDACKLLKEAFRQLKMHGQKIALGVTDRNRTSHGIWKLFSPRSKFHLLKQDRRFVFLIVRICANELDIIVSKWVFELREVCPAATRDKTVQKFASEALDVTRILSPSRSLKFNVLQAHFSLHIIEFELIWDHEERSLEMSGLAQWCPRLDRNVAFNLLEGLDLVAAAKITELTLSSCRIASDIDHDQFIKFIQTCSKTLERVKLSGIVIAHDSKWSPVLRLLARAPYLAKFELVTLSRQFQARVSSEKRTVVVVYVDEWSGHGGNISAELDDLAAAVEADESTWESLSNNDPKKWMYRMTGRKKTPNTLDAESANDNGSFTFANLQRPR